MKFVVLFLCLLVVLIAPQKQPLGKNSSSSLQTIHTEIGFETNQTIVSNFTSEEYMLNILLPHDYDANRSLGYSLLIFLDYKHPESGVDTTFSNYILNDKFYNWTLFTQLNDLPETIIVTIMDIHQTYSSLQSDMTSVNNTYSFLESEALPLLNQSYNLNLDEITLVGGDYAGLFILKCFLQYPDSPFKYYLSIYPNIATDQSSVDKLENYMHTHTVEYNHRILYLAVHSFDPTSGEYLINFVWKFFERGYVTQTIVPVFVPYKSFIPDVMQQGMRASYIQQPIISFITDVEYKYSIYAHSDPRYYANKTTEIVFTGSLGNLTSVEWTWLLDNEIISYDPSFNFTVSTVDEHKISLEIKDNYNITYSKDRTFHFNVPSTPPFDFRTASTTLNTESYNMKQSEKRVPFPFFAMIALLPISRILKKLKFANCA